eukprot:SAG11_NODE_13888_length_634_cov_3.338318_1_plen_162_part_10
MRMQQLVLCVVVFASCGCGVVEGFESPGTREFIDGFLPSCITDTNELSRVTSDLRLALGEGSECGREAMDGGAYVPGAFGRESVFSVERLQEELAAGRCARARDIIISNCLACEDDLSNLTPTGCADADAPGEDDVPAVTKKPPNNSCPYAHDGECDEPMYC